MDNRFSIDAGTGPCREYDRRPGEFSTREKTILRAAGNAVKEALTRFMAVLDGTAFHDGNGAKLALNTSGSVPDADLDSHNVKKADALADTLSSRMQGLMGLYLKGVGDGTENGAPVTGLIKSDADFRFGGSEKGPKNTAHLITIPLEELRRMCFGIDDQRIVSMAEPSHRIPGSKPEPIEETPNEKQVRVTLKRNEFVRRVLHAIDEKMTPFFRGLRDQYHNPTFSDSADYKIGYLRCVYELMPNGDLKISLLRKCNSPLPDNANYRGEAVGMFFRDHFEEQENATTTRLYE